MRTARLFNCTLCHTLVVICSHCDRGNIYCSPQCAQSARRTSLCEAGQRYQNTYPGKLSHARRQQRYRQRHNNKKVTHHTSQEQVEKVSLNPRTHTVTRVLVCHFCKQQVAEQLRLSFLRHNAWYQAVIQEKVTSQTFYKLLQGNNTS